MSSVHSAIAAKISKIAGAGYFNTPRMLWWRSGTAQKDKEGGNYECSPFFKPQASISNTHREISNPKHQITNKFQIPVSNDTSLFGIPIFQEDVKF
jgi:hypothetical protein